MMPPDSTLLSVDETARRRFEADRQGGSEIAFEAYLPPESDPRFLPTLEELIHIDLEWAWRKPDASGSGRQIETYLERFSQLRSPAILHRLVCQEYEVRHRYGDRPTPEAYFARFPELDLSKLTAQTVEYIGRPDQPPEIPGYTILEPLGRGGMGVVYLAKQDALGRVVALKVIRGRAADSLDRARFKTEAEAAAALNHPNVVQVYEVGEAQGQPFLALEYVSGGTLDRALAGTPQAPKLAAETVEALARAVRAAHAAGVLHRDLKPANILLAVAESGSLPWVPKVADFGLAKRIGESGQTESGAVLGTPSYMAPEQASGRKEIGPAADIYGLGAILYEMVTGRPPFRAATSFDTVMQVIHEEPLPPSRLVPRLPRDLETICLKCLEKDPSRRYGSAEELAADLLRFRNDEPISARRIGSVERAARWVKRRPTAAGLLAALLVALVASSVGAVALYFNGELQTAFDSAESRRIEADEQRTIAEKQKAIADSNAAEASIQKGEAEKQRTEAEKQRAEADTQRERAEQYQYYAHVRLAQQAWNEGDVPRMLELLDRYPPARRGLEWLAVRRLSRNMFVLRSHEHDVNSVSFASDGRRVATASFDNTVVIWDALDGKYLRTLRPPKGKVNYRVGDVRFHPDGVRVAASQGPVVTLIHLDNKSGVPFSGHSLNVTGIAFDRTGERMATCSLDGTAVIWNVVTAKPLFTLRGEKDERITAIEFDTTGQRLLWTSRFEASSPVGIVTTGAAKAWDLGTRAELFRKSWFGFQASSVAFHPNGKQVALALRDGSIRIHSWPEGAEQSQIKAHEKGASCVRYSPDGSQLASTGYDLAVRLWDSAGNQTQVLRGHTGRPARDKNLGESGVMQLDFNPSGTRLASVGDDRTLMIWDVAPSIEGVVRPERPKLASGIYSPDRSLVAVWKKPVFQIRDAEKNALLHALKPDSEQPVTSWFSPRGDRVALECGRPTRSSIQIWDARSGQSLLTAAVAPDEVLDITDDGQWLMAKTNAVRLWNLSTRAETKLAATSNLPVKRAIVNRSKTLAVTILDPEKVAKQPWDLKYADVPVWDMANGKQVATLRGHAWTIRTAAWAPDGETIATCSQDETIRIWNARTGQVLRSLRGHKTTIYDIEFSTDGKRLISCGEDRTLRMWDPQLGEEILTLGTSEEYVTGLEFGPKEAFITTRSGPKGTYRIWDLRPLDR